MLKQYDCPVCEGSKRLRYARQVGLIEEEVETECWACRGSGVVFYQEDNLPEHLKTIVPQDSEKEEKEDDGETV